MATAQATGDLTNAIVACASQAPNPAVRGARVKVEGTVQYLQTGMIPEGQGLAPIEAAWGRIQVLLTSLCRCTVVLFISRIPPVLLQLAQPYSVVGLQYCGINMSQPATYTITYSVTGGYPVTTVSVSRNVTVEVRAPRHLPATGAPRPCVARRRRSGPGPAEWLLHLPNALPSHTDPTTWAAKAPPLTDLCHSPAVPCPAAQLYCIPGEHACSTTTCSVQGSCLSALVADPPSPPPPGRTTSQASQAPPTISLITTPYLGTTVQVGGGCGVGQVRLGEPASWTSMEASGL